MMEKIHQLKGGATRSWVAEVSNAYPFQLVVEDFIVGNSGSLLVETIPYFRSPVSCRSFTLHSEGFFYLILRQRFKPQSSIKSINPSFDIILTVKSMRRSSTERDKWFLHQKCWFLTGVLFHSFLNHFENI